MDKIAIVILNWNGASMMRRYLPAVMKYSGGDATVYVADNASTDGSLDMLSAEFPECKVIKFDKNWGFAEGYNKALAQIEAEYYLLLNSDIEVSHHWLTPLVEFMDTHRDAAACQPKLLSWYDKTAFEYAGAAGGFIDRYGYPFCRGRIMGTVEKDEGQYDTVAPVFWVTGAALFIRRADYMEAGGLDSRFFAHMEEIDLCWRLRARGRGVVCIPGSVVCHVGAATLKRENPRKTFLNFRNNLLMLYKNLPAEELGKVMRVRWLLDQVAAFVFLLKGQWDNACAVWRARREYCRLRPSFRLSREENEKKACTSVIPERTRYSVLIRYYLQGKKRFSGL